MSDFWRQCVVIAQAALVSGLVIGIVFDDPVAIYTAVAVSSLVIVTVVNIWWPRRDVRGKGGGDE